MVELKNRKLNMDNLIKSKNPNLHTTQELNTDSVDRGAGLQNIQMQLNQIQKIYSQIETSKDKSSQQESKTK